MMTPQEVASRVFAKATFGGYNMTMVDEFLDQLTEDYAALYNDNTILKNKLKVLSESIEEYRATDVAMRKTLLAAQQMAESMVNDAEKKKSQLEKDATESAAHRMAQLQAQIAAEEFRLQQAQQATAAYVKKLYHLHKEEMEHLSRLGQMVPPGTEDILGQGNPKPEPNPESKPEPEPQLEQGASTEALDPQVQAQPKTATFSPALEEEPTQAIPKLPQKEPEATQEQVDDLDLDATRRFEDLKFGKDYQIQ